MFFMEGFTFLFMKGERKKEKKFSFQRMTWVWQIPVFCVFFLVLYLLWHKQRPNNGDCGIACRPAILAQRRASATFTRQAFLHQENGLRTQLKDLSLGAIDKGLLAPSSINEKFQLPSSASSQRGAFQLTKLGSLSPTPKLPSWKRQGDCLASSEKPLQGSRGKFLEAPQTGFRL